MHMDFLGFHVTTTNANTRFDLWFNGARYYSSPYAQTNLTYNKDLTYVINKGGGYEFFDIWHGNKNKGKCTMTLELKIKNFYVE